MIDFGAVLGIARSEMRLTRRLVRFWVFAVLAWLVTLAFFGYYGGVLYGFFSSWSPSVGMMNPRYFAGYLGFYFVVGMLLAAVFLAFDVRARDKRERMFEVLDTRPSSNLEYVLGKFIGLVLCSWFPLAITCLSMWLLGLILKSPVEPWSILAMTTVAALPAVAFTVGLTMFVSLVVRFRLVAAVLVLGGLVGIFFVLYNVPIKAVPLVDVTGLYMFQQPSDLVSGLVDRWVVIQRTGVLLIALALAAFSAAIYPRLDSMKRSIPVGVGIVALALGGLAVWIPANDRYAWSDRMQGYQEAHAARASVVGPSIGAIEGSVDIEPGRQLQAELVVGLSAPEGESLDSLLLTLNPGFEIDSLGLAGGGELEYTHDEGLLEIDLGRVLAAGEEVVVEMAYSGMPDASFAYFDATKSILDLGLTEAAIFILGTESGYFRKDYVALMPGQAWLPKGGAYSAGRSARASRDPFTLSLDVALPEGWLVAGPGRRHDAGGGVFRYAPPAPIDEVALIAGEFQSFSTEVEGVELEVLLDEDHAKVAETFADAGGVITERVAGWLGEARELGLAYPYGALTLVEVPVGLRGYGGGWRMGSTLAPPAMVLLRETGLPTAKWSWAFRDPERFENEDGGLPAAKRDRLERYFEYDFTGGNLFLGVTRNLLATRTAPEGAGAEAIDETLDQVIRSLVLDKTGYFSPLIFDQSLNSIIGQLITDAVGQAEGGGTANFAESMVRIVTSRPSVWEQALEQSLAEIDVWEDPRRSNDVLVLKTRPMAESLIEILGRAETGLFLSRLVEAHDGGRFNRDDMVAAAGESGPRVKEWLELWIDGTDLPGFSSGRAKSFRLEDAAGGSPRYQLRFDVTNDEPVPGLLQIRYVVGGDDSRTSESIGPYFVPGRSTLEVGIVTERPAFAVQVRPFLALNRLPFDVTVPRADSEETVRSEPFDGTRVVPVEVAETERLVIDDLDPGFSVTNAEPSGLLERLRARLDSSGRVGEFDGGLPVAVTGVARGRWVRSGFPESFGKYRHTAALIRVGAGEARATWSVEIPESGRYRLEVFVPSTESESLFVRRYERGTWTYSVSGGGFEADRDIDADEASAGWNELGEFELSRGRVEVSINDDAPEGRVVIADAVRWTPVGETGTESR